jgi:RNA polymerase sigma-70 factor (ECF subfamily)
LGLQENDCADLVQDVLATLVEKLPVFRLTPLGSFRAWLRTILLNRWRNLQRRQPMQALPDDASPGEHGDVADVLGEQEYHRLLVARALQLLQTDFKETTWRAFWECSINGRPAEDVANELGISRGALHVARSRVLHRLREELAGLLD